MRGLLRAEVLKLLTARAYAGLVLAAAAVAVLGTASTVSAGGAAAQGALAEQQFFLIAATSISVFAVVLGVKSSTDEFRYGTIQLSLLLRRRASALVVAKALVCCAAGVLLAVLALLAMLVVAAALGWSGWHGGEGVGRPVLALVAGTGAWAVLGAAVGSVVRHQVPAVVTAMTWVLLVENIGAGLAGAVAKWLPGRALDALIGGNPADELLSEPVAALVLGAYLVGATLTAALCTARRDV